MLLRDPLELQISFYNWQMMDNLAKGLGTYSFDWHLRALPRDFIAHFLLSRWLEIPWRRLMAMTDARKYATLNRTLADFWFVGAPADCDRVIEALGPSWKSRRPRRGATPPAEQQGRTGWRLLTAERCRPRPAARSSPVIGSTRLCGKIGAGRLRHRRRYLPPAPNRTRTAGFSAMKSSAPGACSAVLPCTGGRLAATGRRSAGLPGDSARDAGEWELAAGYYREALRAMPTACAIWVQYGHALKETGHVGAAEKAYRRSLSLSPDTADTHLQLGHVLKLQGRTDEATAAYLRSAALDPALRHPRDELIGLGWTRERIERTVRASASATSGVPGGG